MRTDLKAFESIVRLKPGLLGPCYVWRASVFVIYKKPSQHNPDHWDFTKTLRCPSSRAKIHLFGVNHVTGERPRTYETSKCGHTMLGTTCPMNNAAVPDGIGYCVPCLYHARKRDELRRWEMREINRCLYSHTPDERDGKRVDTLPLMGKGGQRG